MVIVFLSRNIIWPRKCVAVEHGFVASNPSMTIFSYYSKSKRDQRVLPAGFFGAMRRCFERDFLEKNNVGLFLIFPVQKIVFESQGYLFGYLLALYDN